MFCSKEFEQHILIKDSELYSFHIGFRLHIDKFISVYSIFVYTLHFIFIFMKL